MSDCVTDCVTNCVTDRVTNFCIFVVFPVGGEIVWCDICFKVRLRWFGADLAKLSYLCCLALNSNVLYIKGEVIFLSRRLHKQGCNQIYFSENVK